MKVNYINANDCVRIDGCWHIKGIPIDDSLLPEDESGYIKEEWVHVNQYELIDALVKQMAINNINIRNKLLKYERVEDIDRQYRDYYTEIDGMTDVNAEGDD